jgi:hypothetical protein
VAVDGALGYLRRLRDLLQRRRGVAAVAELRLLQWRGDPVARLILPATKADPSTG